MIMTEKKLIEQIPVLCCYNDTAEHKKLAILAHGFTASKEIYQKNGLLADLAKSGFYALAMDNRFHGERAGEKFESAILNEFGKIDMLKLRKAIKGTADDISVIIDNVIKDNIISTESINVAGISMGGFATFRAIVSDKRITSAATIIASPYWDDIPGDLPVEKNKLSELLQYSEEFQPAAYVDRIYPTSLLIQYAKGDPHYKADKIRNFYSSLQKYYSENPQSICLKEYDINKHEYTDEMLANVVDWFSNK